MLSWRAVDAIVVPVIIEFRYATSRGLRGAVGSLSSASSLARSARAAGPIELFATSTTSSLRLSSLTSTSVPTSTDHGNDQHLHSQTWHTGSYRRDSQVIGGGESKTNAGKRVRP
jgi:hypothetical protein